LEAEINLSAAKMAETKPACDRLRAKNDVMLLDYSQRHAQYTTWKRRDHRLQSLMTAVVVQEADRQTPITEETSHQRRNSSLSLLHYPPDVDSRRSSWTGQADSLARARASTRTNLNDYFIAPDIASLPLDDVLVSWKHVQKDKLDRLEANRALQDQSNGRFLLRNSTTNPSAKVLCVKHDGVVWHFLIERSVGKYVFSIRLADFLVPVASVDVQVPKPSRLAIVCRVMDACFRPLYI
jgi:hypothetical protein